MPFSHRTTQLSMETLESRLTPSVSVRFDYAYDTSGLFNNPSARAALDRVGAAITARMDDSLAAISQTGTNTWTAQVYDSAAGVTRSLPGLSVGANEVVVYVTGGQLGSPLAIASGGAYSARGSQTWLDAIRTRGQGGVDAGTDFSPWGGLIAFNTTTNWDFAAGTPAANQYDFDSVALHEMMHVFGFGLNNPSYTRHVNGGYFTGPNAVSVYGSSIPMQLGDAVPDHFTAGTKYAGQDAIMNPAIQPGTAKQMTELEYASLRDVGWGNGGASVPPAVTVPPVAAVPTTPSPVTSLPTTAGDRFAVSTDRSTGGSVSVYNGSGALVSQTPGLSRSGGTQVATGDVDGDGVAETVYGSAANDLPWVTVVSGRTGATVATFLAYEEAFRGGVNVAVGHVTGGTRADIVVGANTGGGPRVRVFRGGDPNQVTADFWGIEDANFRGGVRVAVGDFNADGRDDVAVSAAAGGGPRVAVYDGRTVAVGRQQKVADFFAFAPTFFGGTYLAAADLNGDGHDDLIVGAGEGGGPHVRVLNGKSMTRGNTTDYVTQFFSGDPTAYHGIRVGAADLNGDGTKELITAPAPGTDGTVRVYAASAFGAGNPAPYMSLSRPEWVAAGAYVG